MILDLNREEILMLIGASELFRDMEEDNIEEERRLAYVGITRAEKSLTMTMARSRKRFGERIICEPSRFLDELPEDEIEWLGGKASKEKATEEKGKSHLAGLKALLG